MNPKSYLFDTHALLFWVNKEGVSNEFIDFFDKQLKNGSLYVSIISFWEIALLTKKGRLKIDNVHQWKSEVLELTHINVISPSASDMINSTLLPDFHKDPFDRILISQANQHKLTLVTRDLIIPKYKVSIFWL